MKEKLKHFIHSIDLSAALTVIGIIILFSGAVIVTLIAPNFTDSTWTMPSSHYQVQMYEYSDPNFYISSAGTGGRQLQYVHHLQQGVSLIAFKETPALRIQAPPELEKYVTRLNDKTLKLTSRLMFLRDLPVNSKTKTDYVTLELYALDAPEAFAVAASDGILQEWAERDFEIVSDGSNAALHREKGVIFINNPVEFRILEYSEAGEPRWRYDRSGKPVASLAELKRPPLAFSSRKELIAEGEHIYAIEGCWYCHTDQTRTLVQDLVLNGSDSYPAPPSSPNEYIYQRITFPGTKRNGPDISRVGVKRPSRDWHRGHFWSPKTASAGSIMPAFRHFFDFDPRGTSALLPGVPNHKFEAIYQYLMTKGTRITPPTEAWWLGKDPIEVKEIIEGKKVLP